MIMQSQRPAFAGWLSTSNDITRTFLAASRVPGLINMAGGLPEPSTFPTTELAAIAADVVHRHTQDVLGYGPVEGLPELRDALAKRFSSPDLTLTRANVFVTSAGMQGLDLVGKVLLEPGQLIACQFPTYLGALDAWRPRSPTYRNLVVEDPAFDAIAALEGAQFAYTVPNFSNPTGRLVGVETRQALVDAAHRTGTWLVEDDPYGTLHYDGPPLPRMIDLSARAHPGVPYAGPVVYMGTLSKEIAPGLRVGWVVAAPGFIEALAMAKLGADMCTSGLTQRVALAAIEAGLIEKIQPVILDIYRKRRDALCAAMREHLSEWLDWEVPVGGMFVWAVGRDSSLNTDLLLQHAMAAGVCVAPSSVFDATGRNRRALRINFTRNDEGQLSEGVRRLARAFEAMVASRT
jgi:2-aminoadipate transaminase